MLIDTYADEKGWTRPTTAEDTQALAKLLADPTQCTAGLVIVTSPSLQMDLRDLPLLRPTSPPSQTASTTP